MAISDRLNKLTTDITSAYTSIENKGGTIPSDKNTDNLHTAIDSIEVIEQATAEGESLSLTNTKAMPYSDYVVKGKSEQEGEPSPSNPVEIHSVADDVNLFDISNIVPTTIMTPNSKGGFKIQRVGDERISEEYPINIPANTNITISRVLKDYSNGTTIYCQWIATDNTTIWTPNIYADTVITSFNKDIKGIRFYLQQTVNDGDYVEIEKLKIQKGTVATPYSPYNQGTVTIKQRGTTESNDYTIQTEPLRSLPNGVKDTIEADGIHRRERKTILDENNISTVSNFGYRDEMPRVYIEKNKLGFKSGWEENICLMNKYKTINKTSLIATGTFSTNFTRGYIEIFNENFTDLQTAKEILLGTEIICQLAEEIIEPLTQNQATTMLDILKTGSYEGTTNIYTDEDVKPTIGVGYYKKG